VAAVVTLLVMLVVVLAAALVVVLVPLVTEPTALVAAFLTESRIPPCASAAAADAGHTTKFEMKTPAVIHGRSGTLVQTFCCRLFQSVIEVLVMGELQLSQACRQLHSCCTPAMAHAHCHDTNPIHCTSI
jgi:hypothetical protein